MRRLFIVICLLTTYGCGESGTALDTGVPPRTPLSDLSDGEAVQTCEAFGDYLGSVLTPSRLEHVACTMSGVAAEAVSGAAGQCEVSRDACLDDPPELEPISAEFNCEEFDASVFADCDGATIGDLEACFTDVGAAVDRIVGKVSCSLAGNEEATSEIEDDLEDIFDGDDLPDSCERLSAACPEANIFE